MYKKFNKVLEKHSKNHNIKYINLDDVLLNKETGRIRQEFVNPNSCISIHLLWEPLIPLLVDKINACNFEKKYIIDLERSLNKYLIDKKTRLKKIKRK